MKVDVLKKVGAEHYAIYYAKKRNVYGNDGHGYADKKLDIKSPHFCIVGYTHKNDLLFGKCITCGHYAIDFMVTITTRMLTSDYYYTLSKEELSESFYKEYIKDNTKSRNRLFKTLVNNYVDHIITKHPDLVTA